MTTYRYHVDRNDIRNYSPTVVHLRKIDLQNLPYPSTEKLSIYLHKSLIVSLLSELFECWDVGSFVLMIYIMYPVQTNVQFLANES